MFTQKELQTLVDGVEGLTVEKLEELLKCCPFQDMLNINILDFAAMRLIINFLTKLSKLDRFYNFTENVKYCWEFILTNLLCLENLPVGHILFDLLQLLKSLISKMKVLNKFMPHILKERERVVNILATAANLEIFVKTHVPVCTDILNDLINMYEPLPPAALKSLANIAVIYKKLQVVHEMVVLCDISFKKFTFPVEFYTVCATWIFKNGPRLLMENIEEGTISLLLKVIGELYNKRTCFENSDTETFDSHLKSASHHIIILSGNPKLRDESLKLLSLLISEYKSQETGVREEYTTVLNNLLLLPVDVAKWPQIQSDTFLFVCSYLCVHSSLLWTSSEVIFAISKFVYSYERFAINWEILKSLCHVYSNVMTNVPDKNTLLLGDDLLIILSRFPYSFPKIVTYHPAQLVWMLRRGCRYVRKQVVVEWLKKGEDLEVLGKAILRCRAGDVLLDVLTDWRLHELTKRSSEMCHRIQDKELSENIALMIPKALHNKTVLGNLILSNPGIPDDPEMSLKICEFMSLVTCLLDDADVLKAACSYSKRLVTTLKKDNNIVSVFCRDMRNIQFLTVKVNYVDEDAAIEILRLLKVLVLVQKRNHNILEDRVLGDFSRSLVGSPNKVEKCLDLLQILLTSKEVFIKIERAKVQSVFTNLFDASVDPRFALRSFICLTGLLKTNEWLARFHSTGIFVEIQCSRSVDERSGPEFLMFLTVWMKILGNWPDANAFYLPDKRVISNYIKRVGFISRGKEMYLLQLLNKIKLFDGKFMANGNGGE